MDERERNGMPDALRVDPRRLHHHDARLTYEPPLERHSPTLAQAGVLSPSGYTLSL